MLLDNINAPTVLFFCPLSTEPDIIPVAKKLLAIGKRIAFPISLTTTYELEFKYVERLEDLVLGAYGIKEPPKDALSVTDFSDALCLVPALAFDKRGFRLGYGKGYYDRFLRASKVKSAGVVYSEFITDRLSVDKHDMSVDIIFTEKGVEIPFEHA